MSVNTLSLSSGAITLAGLPLPPTTYQEHVALIGPGEQTFGAQREVLEQVARRGHPTFLLGHETRDRNLLDLWDVLRLNPLHVTPLAVKDGQNVAGLLHSLWLQQSQLVSPTNTLIFVGRGLGPQQEDVHHHLPALRDARITVILDAHDPQHSPGWQARFHTLAFWRPFSLTRPFTGSIQIWQGGQALTPPLEATPRPW